MTNSTKAIRFYKAIEEIKPGSKELFKANLPKHQRGKIFFGLNPRRPEVILTDAFLWTITPEGYMYWCKISEELQSDKYKYLFGD